MSFVSPLGSKIVIESAIPRSVTLLPASKPRSDWAARCVAASVMTDPSASSMSRAALFTTLPIIVYSERRSLPTVPQKTRPVAMPIEVLSPIPRRSDAIRMALFTARAGLSSWLSGGSPNAVSRVAPFSSMLILSMLPP